MTEHCIIMTVPRDGPFTAKDPRSAILRKLGFLPVPSVRTKGCSTNWIRHWYDVREIFDFEVHQKFIQPMIAANLVPLDMIVVTEYEKLRVIRALPVPQ